MGTSTRGKSVVEASPTSRPVAAAKDRIAAIDIGSNAVRLLVGEVIERDDHPVIKKQTLVRLPIRLGEDVFDNGLITTAKCDNLIKGLKSFRLLTEVYGVRYMRCCATSAMREAGNRDAVLARVEMESGVHIETIAGKTEADLIVNTFWTQDLLKERCYLYIDVGGGSTELTWLENGKRLRSASFEVGTVRSLAGKVKEEAWEEMAAFLDELKEEHGAGIAPTVVVDSASGSGAVDTLTLLAGE